MQRQRHKNEQYSKEEERNERKWQPLLYSECNSIIHDQAVQLMFVHNDVLHPTHFINTF